MRKHENNDEKKEIFSLSDLYEKSYTPCFAYRNAVYFNQNDQKSSVV